MARQAIGCARMADSDARRTACVLTVSDRAANGTYVDRSGPAASQALQELGFQVDEIRVVPDGGSVSSQLRAWIESGVPLVITTGGTGLSSRDLTPEQTASVIDRLVPGIAERVRAYSVDRVPAAALSRGIAGTAGMTLIVNLPGSVGGVNDGIAALADVLGHAIDQLSGVDHGTS